MIDPDRIAPTPHDTPARDHGEGGSWAFALSADGTARRMPLADARGCMPSKLLWVHVDGREPDGVAWLDTETDLPRAIHEALRAMETRPRAEPLGDGALVNLRGVNMAPDADPEDLVSIRVWAEAGRVVSVSYRPTMALADLCEIAGAGHIRDPGDFIAQLADTLTRRLDAVIGELGAELDTLEDDLIGKAPTDLRERIAAKRRAAIGLRRFILPQREALATLAVARLAWLEDEDRLQLHEAANRVTRMTEELDAVRERAAVLADQLSDRRAEATSKRTLLLSVVSAIFLPLTFFTGLIGMNVPLPFEGSGAFWVILGFNLAFATTLIAFFRWRRWF